MLFFFWYAVLTGSHDFALNCYFIRVRSHLEDIYRFDFNREQRRDWTDWCYHFNSSCCCVITIVFYRSRHRPGRLADLPDYNIVFNIVVPSFFSLGRYINLLAIAAKSSGVAMIACAWSGRIRNRTLLIVSLSELAFVNTVDIGRKCPHNDLIKIIGSRKIVGFKKRKGLSYQSCHTYSLFTFYLLHIRTELSEPLGIYL